MLISRTPLRVSFLGGGTDLKEYYKNDFGAVISTAINKYVYLTINGKFENDLRVKYSKTENVESAEKLEHPIFREAMKFAGVTRGVEVTSMADMPTRGSGLGSSSTFTVGLLNVLHKYKGQNSEAEKLASEACKIEIDVLKEPVGKQDQYAAAYGGFNYIKFNADESVSIEPVKAKKNVLQELENSMSLFYTGVERSASTILTEQKKVSGQGEKNKTLTEMREQATEAKKAIEKGDLNLFGDILNKGWELKKKLVGGITNSAIDAMYEKARKAGATGGKICGAGGGGFVLIYAPDGKIAKVREALKAHKELRFKFEPEGSKIVFNG
ncbi:TPA: GHMP kinase [archaeon]|nr:GHMP kinase [Candidatus Naiadarchaeales archaeon SRR2090153.bin461]